MSVDGKFSGRWVAEGPDHNGDDLFDLDAQTAVERVSLADGDGWLLVNIRDELHIDFAVFDFAQGDANSGGVRYHLLFRGCGPSGNLRECRHIYWRPAEDGYVFYAPFQVIIDAFTALRRWFDSP